MSTTLTIAPVTRIEGHAKITLLLNDSGEVADARFHVTELRGFEKFCIGRSYREMPGITARICGICPVSHSLASAKAGDAIKGVKIPPTAHRLRRLMTYAQLVQSHALSFFHLSGPDLLLGMESDAGQRHIFGLVDALPELAREGILLRKFGQEVIRLTAGKRIHGTGSIPGGVNKSLTEEERDGLLADIYTMIAWSRGAVHLVRDLHAQNPALYNSFGAFRANFMSLTGIDGALDFYHGRLRARSDKGDLLFDGVDYRGYADLIHEEVKPWSYMKFPFITALGPEKGWYRVGPLSRVQNCDVIPTPLAEAERREFVDYSGGTPTHAPLAYHWARMIEMLHAVETIKDLLHDDDIVGDDLVAGGERAMEGVGVIEAPRGTLIHHYRVGEDDLVTMCNLIVSTTHNNQAMNEAIRNVAKRYLRGHEVTEGLLNHIEVAIRAFDPCLSCATHALGKMPLAVELVDADGRLVDAVTRDEGGLRRIGAGA